MNKKNGLVVRGPTKALKILKPKEGKFGASRTLAKFQRIPNQRRRDLLIVNLVWGLNPF